MFFLLFDFISHLNNRMNCLIVIVIVIRVNHNLIGFGFDHLINLRLLLNELLAFVVVIVNMVIVIVIIMVMLIDNIMVMVILIKYIDYC